MLFKDKLTGNSNIEVEHRDDKCYIYFYGNPESRIIIDREDWINLSSKVSSEMKDIWIKL